MKNLIFVTLMFMTGGLISWTTINPLDTWRVWEKLGERRVNFGLDHDEILVTRTEGNFTAIKIMVKRAPVNFHRLVIHFGNGGLQEVELRNEIPAGGETRVIDIKGGDRIIRKVVFWYDTKNRADIRAEIELWGRH